METNNIERLTNNEIDLLDQSYNIFYDDYITLNNDPVSSQIDSSHKECHCNDNINLNNCNMSYHEQICKDHDFNKENEKYQDFMKEYIPKIYDNSCNKDLNKKKLEYKNNIKVEGLNSYINKNKDKLHPDFLADTISFNDLATDRAELIDTNNYSDNNIDLKNDVLIENEMNKQCYYNNNLLELEIDTNQFDCLNDKVYYTPTNEDIYTYKNKNKNKNENENENENENIYLSQNDFLLAGENINTNNDIRNNLIHELINIDVIDKDKTFIMQLLKLIENTEYISIKTFNKLREIINKI